MIVRWTAVQEEPNDIGEPRGRRCECGKYVPHEHLEIYDADGQLLDVQRVTSNGLSVRIVVDALKPVQKVMN